MRCLDTAFMPPYKFGINPVQPIREHWMAILDMHVDGKSWQTRSAEDIRHGIVQDRSLNTTMCNTTISIKLRAYAELGMAFVAGNVKMYMKTRRIIRRTDKTVIVLLIHRRQNGRTCFLHVLP